MNQPETNTNQDIIMIRLNEFPETLKTTKIYKILKQQYTNLNPLIPMLREIYERETILTNLIDMSYIISELKQISPHNISSNINYDFALKNKHIISPYLSYLLSFSKDNKIYKTSETVSEYIYDISLLLMNSREKLLKKIIKNKRIKLLDYCIEKNIIENNIYNISELLVKYNNIELLNIYYKNDPDILSNERFHNITIISIQNGSIECLEFIYEIKKNEWEWSSEMCNIAIKNNKIESMKFIFEKTQDKCPFNEFSFAYACENGNINMVNYLYEHKCPVDYISILYAAKANHLDIIKYLYYRGVSLYFDICLYATINNNFDMLVFAHSNGCNIDSTQMPGKLCYYAVLNDNLDMLKYLVSNGSFYDKEDLYKILNKKQIVHEESELSQYIMSL